MATPTDQKRKRAQPAPVTVVNIDDSNMDSITMPDASHQNVGYGEPRATKNMDPKYRS